MSTFLWTNARNNVIKNEKNTTRIWTISVDSFSIPGYRAALRKNILSPYLLLATQFTTKEMIKFHY